MTRDKIPSASQKRYLPLACDADGYCCCYLPKPDIFALWLIRGSGGAGSILHPVVQNPGAASIFVHFDGLFDPIDPIEQPAKGNGCLVGCRFGTSVTAFESFGNGAFIFVVPDRNDELSS